MAQKIWAKVQTQIAEGKWLDVDNSRNFTFEEMMERFMAEHAQTRAEGTQRRYVSLLAHLSPFFEGMKLSDIDTNKVLNYAMERRSEGSSTSTRNRELAMLSKAFNLARLWKWTRENPCHFVTREKEDNEIGRALTVAEEKLLLDACRGRCNGHLVDMVTLALNTGVREGQVLKLRWEHIDLGGKEFRTQNEKTDKWYSVSMNRTVHEMLVRKSKVRSISGYVFTTGNDTPFLARNMYREFRKAVKESGISGNLRFHDLRVTCGTRIGERFDILAVATVLNHSQLSTSQRYVKRGAQSRRAILESLDPVPDSEDERNGTDD
ncbi:MAG: tyrosine-type recombinase/integrase [Nitrospiraceae bacterium]|nr:tyrosine-type recombinase/integrase [Nitrospiraceae bacterium]